jgi:hypothetical protein
VLSRPALKEVIHRPHLSKTRRLLVLLAVTPLVPRNVAELSALAASAGVNIRSWSVESLLRKSGLAIRVHGRWELTDDGKRSVQGTVGEALQRETSSDSLRGRIEGIANPQTRSFLEEAVACRSHGLHRAAVVLSWVGAVALLYEHVVAAALTQFNAEAVRRNPKWRAAVSADDLAKMKEHDFLEVIEATSIIGKNVKQALQSALQLRNACGHPNSMVVGAHSVANHLEVLTLNVFDRFAIGSGSPRLAIRAALVNAP